MKLFLRHIQKIKNQHQRFHNQHVLNQISWLFKNQMLSNNVSMATERRRYQSRDYWENRNVRVKS